MTGPIYGDGGRVCYVDPEHGPTFGTVPVERRCRGCRTWATHRWNNGSRDRRNERQPICLDCARLWESYGVIGEVVPW